MKTKIRSVSFLKGSGVKLIDPFSNKGHVIELRGVYRVGVAYSHPYLGICGHRFDSMTVREQRRIKKAIRDSKFVLCLT